MNELYKLDQTAADGYASYNFPKGETSSCSRNQRSLSSIVMNSLSNFANITLSSLYFDITKDCLYANDLQSVERRAVVTTLARVSDLVKIYDVFTVG
jgi:isoleucyl-tRNA synthetase